LGLKGLVVVVGTTLLLVFLVVIVTEILAYFKVHIPTGKLNVRSANICQLVVSRSMQA
jgi:hypothetical protein